MKGRIQNFRIGQLDILFILLSLIFFFAGFVLIVRSIIIGIVLLIIGSALISYRRGVKIDYSSGRFREYESMLNIPWGEWESFNNVEKLYINRGKRSRKTYTPRTNNSTTTMDVIYKAFVMFDGERKVLISEDKKLNKVKKNLEKVANVVKIGMQENFSRN